MEPQVESIENDQFEFSRRVAISTKKNNNNQGPIDIPQNLLQELEKLSFQRGWKDQQNIARPLSDFKFNLVTIGEPNAGKTSLIFRLAKNSFSENSMTT